MPETITLAKGETATVERTVRDPNLEETFTVTGALSLVNGAAPPEADPAWLTVSTLNDGAVEERLQQRLQITVDAWAAKKAGVDSFTVEATADDRVYSPFTRSFTFTLSDTLQAGPEEPAFAPFFHIKAEDLALSDGDAVATWPDEGTGANDGALTSGEVVYQSAGLNGYSVVAFRDGYMDFDLGGVGALPENTARLAVFKYLDELSTLRRIWSNDGGSSSIRVVLQGDSNAELRARYGGSSYYTVGSSSEVSRFALLNMHRTAGTDDDIVQINGVTTYTGPLGSSTYGWIRLGDGASAPSQYSARFLLAELVELRDPTAQDVADWSAYLTEKYFTAAPGGGYPLALVGETTVTYGASSSITTITQAVPEHVEADDLIVASLMHRAGAEGITPPAGFERAAQADASDASFSQWTEVWTKTAAGTEGDLTFTGAAAGRMGLQITVVRGASGTPTLEDVQVQSGTSGPITIPAATSGGADRLVLGVSSNIYAQVSGATDLIFPAGWTQLAPQTLDGNRLGVALQQVGSGATPTAEIDQGTMNTFSYGALALVFAPA